ncbi:MULTISPECIES: glutamate 5-kinase [unclassified Neisseria]|uniref:glutamate 5-kinase n=1 Tax=unclassified Neisseria TaxID=2623750 RepID=UPI0026655D75|nr:MULTISPECIES: glutamate 5-kinase [unclassified Neisseria]MDO1509779.1 glutamate 5-kinase [Neisseria sp. MVDL19-042950]MDO1515897.1 glutamate 5-kinase [Neisseria sp. MVDL18-041461]MDO1563010.1 glutamate 5-kinase [Neisseria sp. MVDL20-010259]
MHIENLSQAHLLVVKVGSSLVTAEGKGIDQAALDNWAAQIAKLKADGTQIIFVSSGAIAEGIKRLGWPKRPTALNELQAAAAVGQMGIAQAYENAFAPHHIHTAQILLTHEDLSNRTRYLNARSTLRTLLNKGIVPIINENDTVTTDEIKLGDNDTLGALVTNLVEADALVILTDQKGLYDSDPRKNPQAELISTIAAEHPELENMAGGAGSSVGTGGMYTKVLAAKRAALSGAATVVASGREPDVLVRLKQGESIGTLFTSEHSRISARKQWLLGHVQLSGSLIVDKGAERAVAEKHASLLPVGCVRVDGHFYRGELVAVLNTEGKEIARGLVNYGSGDTAKILGTPSDQIADRLGYAAEDELIHRDNMALHW